MSAEARHLWAFRIEPPTTKPSPLGLAAKNGLRYERKVGRELERFFPLRFSKIEHNPWFVYADGSGGFPHDDFRICSPDFLLHLDDRVIVVEVKLTWVPDALPKLTAIYCPVVAVALNKPTIPLIICRNLTSEVPPATHSLQVGIAELNHLLHWPEIGALPW